MKKLLALSLLLAVSASASANFNGNQQAGGGFIDGHSNVNLTTVQQAAKAKDDTPVTLVGHITGRIKHDDDEFMFQDQTGSIKIEVEDHAWNGQQVGPNDKITIYGKVDTHGFGKSSIDVYRIQKH